MFRAIWPRFWAITLLLLIGGVLWNQVSTKPPLATPPPDVTRPGVPAVMATTLPIPTLFPLRTSTPSPTLTATPEPMVLPPPRQAITSDPPDDGAGTGPKRDSRLPAAVRLGADEKGRYLLIDQATQTMHVFDGWHQIRAFPVSTGIPDPETLTPEWSGLVGEYVGTFKSFGTYQDDGWYLFSQGGGILFHGAPYTSEESGRKIYQDLDALGQRPSSHGCIRLAPEDAAWLTEWSPYAVPVTITAWPSGQPERESVHDEEKGVG